MSRYAKLVAVLVGLAALMVHRHYGVSIEADVQSLAVDAILALVTAAGVYFARNKEPT